MARCAPKFKRIPKMEKVELFLWPSPGPIGAGANDELDPFNHGLLANGDLIQADYTVDSIHFPATNDMFPKPNHPFALDDLHLAMDLEELIHQGPEREAPQALSNSSSFSDFMQTPDACMEDLWYTSDVAQKENAMMDWGLGIGLGLLDVNVAVWPVMAGLGLGLGGEAPCSWAEDKAGVVLAGAAFEEARELDDLLLTLMAYSSSNSAADAPVAAAQGVSHPEPASMPPPLQVPLPIQPAAPAAPTSPPASKPTKAGPRRRSGGVVKSRARGMTERKRDQNKKAANRYRSKKRRQEEEAMEVHQALLRERDALLQRRQDLTSQIHMALGLVEKRLRRA
ncbi:uncharacterized protein LOC129590933 [Paramacrobiotus metropolitanus]|uniref:uncharacterized protein LOC129590933 n=1 Tax=Paramacrobiotus metropolitanus TaxID=2943436 RepID=UPI0024458834|nr:uncharacterized protein LOC129590933 [Paramacrobiotus metropolitanus]